ncbi:MAG: DUF4377 domain-containing protein [Woeseiaceae bacterium]|nr:DUF4377 domain-containing protein [Woeseiaceae bacterium]
MRLLTGMLLLVAAVSLVACSSGSDSDSGETEERLLFDHFQVECFGLGATFCLSASRDDGQTYQGFFAGIEGFNYQWGTTYDVIIASRRVENPPADGPSRTYRLVRILNEADVPAGTLFDLAIRESSGIRATADRNIYEIHFQRLIECATADCQMIESFIAQQFAIRMEFRHADVAGGPLVLTQIKCAAPRESFNAACPP